MRHKAYRPARTAVCAALTAGLLATGAGCSGDADRGADGPRPAPSPRTTSPQELCTALITRWGQELLAAGDSGYGDYQSMGLSNAQYEILRDVLDAARAERRRNGPDAAGELMRRQSDERCTELYRDGVPTGGPWQ
ncbi:hypothetical protein ACWGI8_05065 [Streptomyces sp. NPDC054841]